MHTIVHTIIFYYYFFSTTFYLASFIRIIELQYKKLKRKSHTSHLYFSLMKERHGQGQGCPKYKIEFPSSVLPSALPLITRFKVHFSIFKRTFARLKKKELEEKKAKGRAREKWGERKRARQRTGGGKGGEALKSLLPSPLSPVSPPFLKGFPANFSSICVETFILRKKTRAAGGGVAAGINYLGDRNGAFSA